jgi:hypothetical protein
MGKVVLMHQVQHVYKIRINRLINNKNNNNNNNNIQRLERGPMRQYWQQADSAHRISSQELSTYSLEKRLYTYDKPGRYRPCS